MDVRVERVQPILRRRRASGGRRPACRGCIWRCRLLKSTTSKSTRPMRADAGGGEIQRRAASRGRRCRCSSTLAGLQLALPLHADLRHDQVAAVALDLVVRQRRQLGFSRRRSADPRTDGMMLTVSPAFTGVCVLLQVADVLVVQVDVDEAAQLALVVVEVLLQVGVLASSGSRAARRPSRRSPRPCPACR